MFSPEVLPIIFYGLMGLSVLVYAILDGYDLGVGMLMPTAEGAANEHQRDKMIASIGPFWDANETWLVLAVGLLLIAFPAAHNIILKALYLPAVIMLIGLILRGVAFDFRAKVALENKATWDKIFKLGSFITALSQGFMLGMYVMGFEYTITNVLFSCLSGIGVAAAYCFIGAAWLVMKTEDDLQKRAAFWARLTGLFCFTGVLLVSVINPLINASVFDKWFTFPFAIFVWSIPLVCFALFIIVDQVLKRIPIENDFGCWLPFACAVLIFTFSFQGLGFSFYPYVVPGQLTIWESASAPESLSFILVGALVVIPIILLYTAFSYRVFWGKVKELTYY